MISCLLLSYCSRYRLPILPRSASLSSIFTRTHLAMPCLACHTLPYSVIQNLLPFLKLIICLRLRFMASPNSMFEHGESCDMCLARSLIGLVDVNPVLAPILQPSKILSFLSFFNYLSSIIFILSSKLLERKQYTVPISFLFLT